MMSDNTNDNTNVIDNENTTRPDPGKGQASPRSLDRKREEHLKRINDQVEEAKDPASYETYDYSLSSADEKIKLFTARRKGISHIIDKTPCQDYCLTASINGCTVLADADGVGSCEHSDIGSKLACEAVVLAVKAASDSNPEEDQLVSRLLSVSFRDRLVSLWIKSVMEEVTREKAYSPEELLEEFNKYGSTIMYAVITRNWIVVGNLGDGQILVFNDCYGVKLRVHAPKDSSRVRCLANEGCAREDFFVAKYPRSCFNGVLMSSDGIYESLDKGNHYYDYCIQLKNRFLERSPHEPYQAFCYKEDGEPYKDFSRMRTQDDCSIAMAIDERDVVSDYEAIMTSLLSHTQAAIFKRWSPTCMSFFTKNNTSYSDVIVSKAGGGDTPLHLNSAVLDVPERTWDEGELRFSEYPDTANPTIEFMRCSGMLRRHKSDPGESEQLILNVYLRIVQLRRELGELGLEFNSSALFNTAFDGKQLHIRKEAVRQIASRPSNESFDGMEMCFSHLLGILESEDKKDPVFDIGFIDRGIKHYRIGHPSDELAQLQRIKKQLYLKNISSYCWKFDDETVLPPGESRELGEKMSFTLLDSEEKELETYQFVSKELL